MKTIHKFGPIGIARMTAVDVPEVARILHFAAQGVDLFFWAEVETDAPTETRRFYVVGTGWDLADLEAETKHVGTVVVGKFVWHLYEGGVK